jgi:formylglycine-generating enzyme required for sulfatase activity
VSDVGAFDMVGNLWEWVADWVPGANDCSDPFFGTLDVNCMTINTASDFLMPGPVALLRGGNYGRGDRSGIFAVGADVRPSEEDYDYGFRCAR